MSNKPHQQPQQHSSSARDQRPTLLVARSKGPRPFTRAGLRFGAEYTAIPLTDLDEARVRRILAEPALDARLMTEHQAAQVVTAQTETKIGEGMSKADLVQAVLAQQDEIKELRARCAKLEVAVMGDRPPAIGETPS